MVKRVRLSLVANDADDSSTSLRKPRRGAARRHNSGNNSAGNNAKMDARVRNGQSYSKDLKAKSPGQSEMMDSIDSHDIVFSIGPAGTGKTHIAIRKAVEFLKAGKISRIILSRPAVEAGRERLGFMPGGLDEKMEPYMRPLYDELLTCVPAQTIKTWMAERVLEIAPLGFMRGRTFSGCFVVVDEAQNATAGQLKMVLTRLGFGSTMVITGDPDQSDLDEGDSGLASVAAQLKGRVSGIDVVCLNEVDVVRHPTVRAMVALLAA